jgi:Flp pilus assembly protein TadG
MHTDNDVWECVVNMFRLFKNYLRLQAGVVAVAFGVAVPLVVTAVGVSIDIGQSYLVRERLSQAVDAAALAAAGEVSEDPKVIEDRVKKFVEANYPSSKIGYVIDVDVLPGEDVLGVKAMARLDTTFMRMFGMRHVDVFVESEVKKEVKAIEVALVMDVTGSMSTNNNISALRTAAKSFVDIMFDRANDPKLVKVGLVPFSTGVNVGSYGLGKTPSGGNYDNSFVDLSKIPQAANRVYYDQFLSNATNTTNRLKWGGCVIEGSYPDDIEDHAGPWKPYRYCRNDSDTVVCDTNNANTKPNNICPRTPIMPLSSDRDGLNAHIAKLEANGNTYVNLGLVWGLRVLSPDFPFREGVAWDNKDWKKAVILMTDGDNQAHTYYSGHGLSSAVKLSNANLNSRVLDVCTELKKKGVLVYTITFYSNISNQTKAVYRECATQPEMWYDAPTQSKLIEVYGKIAKELSNLHISK